MRWLALFASIVVAGLFQAFIAVASIILLALVFHALAYIQHTIMTPTQVSSRRSIAARTLEWRPAAALAAI